MNRNCDKLRERALQAGMESAEAAAWRIHCRHCPDCRTELFLLETLQRQARCERQHLGKRELSELLEVARRSYDRRRRTAPVKAWLWRAASVCLLAGVAWHAGRLGRPPVPAEGAGANLTFLAASPDAAYGNYGVPLAAAGSDHDRALRTLSSPPQPAPLPGIVPGQFVHDLLLNLRDEIEQRRQELLDLQDDAEGGWEPGDAEHRVLPHGLAAA